MPKNIPENSQFTKLTLQTALNEENFRLFGANS